MAYVTGLPSISLDQLRGRLLSIEHIASGGFSEVWRGEWKRPNDGVVQVVAIKYLKRIGMESSTSGPQQKERLMK
ncbi:hypothetical protein FRC04_005220, partial [Tulasnella sp. 424]